MSMHVTHTVSFVPLFSHTHTIRFVWIFCCYSYWSLSYAHTNYAIPNLEYFGCAVSVAHSYTHRSLNYLCYNDWAHPFACCVILRLDVCFSFDLTVAVASQLQKTVHIINKRIHSQFVLTFRFVSFAYETTSPTSYTRSRKSEWVSEWEWNDSGARVFFFGKIHNTKSITTSANQSSQRKENTKIQRAPKSTLALTFRALYIQINSKIVEKIIFYFISLKSG